MKKTVMLFLSFSCCLATKAQVVNDPNAEIREAKNFSGISLSSAFDVYLSQSNEEAVAVSAAKAKYRDQIVVEVKDGILYVRYNNQGIRWNRSNQKLKAYISFKQLDNLDISGACDVFIAGVLKSNRLAIKQSGASDLKGKLEVNKLTVHLSGASDINVSGTATHLSVDASGASEFKGYDLVTDNCDAKASGASEIRITVHKEIFAQASGASYVKYRGNAVIRDIRSSGSSSIRKE